MSFLRALAQLVIMLTQYKGATIIRRAVRGRRPRGHKHSDWS